MTDTLFPQDRIASMPEFIHAQLNPYAVALAQRENLSGYRSRLDSWFANISPPLENIESVRGRLLDFRNDSNVRSAKYEILTDALLRPRVDRLCYEPEFPEGRPDFMITIDGVDVLAEVVSPSPQRDIREQEERTDQITRVLRGINHRYFCNIDTSDALPPDFDRARFRSDVVAKLDSLSAAGVEEDEFYVEIFGRNYGADEEPHRCFVTFNVRAMPEVGPTLVGVCWGGEIHGERVFRNAINTKKRLYPSWTGPYIIVVGTLQDLSLDFDNLIEGVYGSRQVSVQNFEGPGPRARINAQIGGDGVVTPSFQRSDRYKRITGVLWLQKHWINGRYLMDVCVVKNPWSDFDWPENLLPGIRRVTMSETTPGRWIITGRETPPTVVALDEDITLPSYTEVVEEVENLEDLRLELVPNDADVLRASPATCS